MATYFRNAIHLESMPPWTNSGDLFQTFDHADMTIETLQVNDTNGNGQIVVDNSNTGYETISYDVGSGTETEEIARSVYARATVELKRRDHPYKCQRSRFSDRHGRDVPQRVRGKWSTRQSQY